MPFSFVILGCLFITILFFYKLKPTIKISLCLAIFLLLTSYFVGKLSFEGFSINILALLAVLVITLQGVFERTKKQWSIFFFVLLVCGGAYFAICYIQPYFLLDFNYLSACLISVIGVLIFARNTLLCLSFMGANAIVIECITYAITSKTFSFYVFFGDNFYIVFALLLATYSLVFFVIKMAKYIRFRQTKIVLCKRGEVSGEK